MKYQLYNKIITDSKELDMFLEYPHRVPKDYLVNVPRDLRDALLKKIPKSLTISADDHQGRIADSMEDFYYDIGSSKNGKSWEARHLVWMRNASYFLYLSEGIFFICTQAVELEYYEEAGDYSIPLFNSYYTPNLQETQETPQMLKSKLVDKVVSTNKDALQLAAKMSVGKAANQVITGKLANAFPWYAKLFGRHKEVVNNPFMRIGTAEAIYAAVQHFQPDNQKLLYVAEAMVQEAMVDVATNSDALKSAISELEALVGHLPNAAK